MCAQHKRSAKGNHRQNGEKHSEVSHVLLIISPVLVLPELDLYRETKPFRDEQLKHVGFCLSEVNPAFAI